MKPHDCPTCNGRDFKECVDCGAHFMLIGGVSDKCCDCREEV